VPFDRAMGWTVGEARTGERSCRLMCRAGCRLRSEKLLLVARGDGHTAVSGAWNEGLTGEIAYIPAGEVSWMLLADPAHTVCWMTDKRGIIGTPLNGAACSGLDQHRSGSNSGHDDRRTKD
jgi:hypothetical protein